MKPFPIICVVCALYSQELCADIKSDILALTGGRELRAAWLRIPWCDADYAPVQEYRDIAGQRTQVCVLGTHEPGGIRLLDNGDIRNHHWDMCFITRKDGSHVVWSNPDERVAYIQAFDGNSPKIDLQLGEDWEVIALHYNPATGDENLFVRSANKSSAYRIPLKSDYTADMSQKTLVISSTWSGGDVDDAFSVSANGIMAGGAFPWPETKILDMNNKTAYVRHAGSFGCNSNIAPDNSYRFFHFFDSHDGLHMFDADLSMTYGDFSLVDNVPGKESFNGMVDCKLPRWTSDVRFMTMTCPGPFGGVSERGNFDLSPNDVQTLNPLQVADFYVGKFAADFRSIEAWALISDDDVRFINGTAGGMVWISDSAGDVSATKTSAATPLLRSIAVRHGAVRAACAQSTSYSLSLFATNGQRIAYSAGKGTVSCFAGRSSPGTCIAQIKTGGYLYAQRITLVP